MQEATFIGFRKGASQYLAKSWPGVAKQKARSEASSQTKKSGYYNAKLRFAFLTYLRFLSQSYFN